MRIIRIILSGQAAVSPLTARTLSCTATSCSCLIVIIMIIIPGDNMIIVLRHPALVMIIMILGDNSW